MQTEQEETMGTAATEAKQRWNKKHYSQVKVSVSPSVAQGFKAACALSDTSMSAELARFMAAYAKATDALPAPAAEKRQAQMGSRQGRRRLLGDIFGQLQDIRDAEESYRGSIPYALT
jgi:ssRNA-specific RNase YbeY (16S rRNA maturation enzyme)